MAVVRGLLTWLSCCLVLLPGASAQDAKRPNKVALLPDADVDASAPIRRALYLHGISELQLDAPSWTAAADTAMYDLLWSNEAPPSNALGELAPRHRINHLDGAEVLSTKLHRSHAALQRQFGAFDFGFVAPAFRLPQDKPALLQAIRDVLNTPLVAEKASVDAAYNRRWLVHDSGRTSLLKGLPQVQRDDVPPNAVVTKYIEPLLISGRKFDLRFFVLIASLDPLRVYVYDNALLRFCTQPYPVNLDASADVASYIVDDNDYLPPWELPDLRDYYTELPSSATEGSNHWRVLKAYLRDHNIDVDRFHRETLSAMTKLIAGRRQILLDAATTSGGFELLGFVFSIQDDGQPFLDRVERSPSLVPRQVFATGAETGLLNNVAADVIQLVGVRAPNQPDLEEATLLGSPAYCKSKCRDQLATWDMTCWRCPGWFSPPVAAQLLGGATEYSRRGQFQLLFPSVQKTEAKFLQGGLSIHDEAFHAYIASFATAAAGGVVDPAVLCVNRDQCSGHGDCINGRCRCDLGFEGFTCYIPRDPNLPAWTDAPGHAVANLRAAGSPAPNRPSFPLVALGLGVVCFGLYQVALKYIVVAQAEKDN
ncbi:hypothetical protein SPRG_02453 [Saprolegnia parasitica CBS 223.65]|uniref:Tubulin--tyrosine ligase-like protein 5 n=1 Tax=Saprolegnia parasitica (strain CBS 223.65) TaxID=695850 RepID=A0A067CU36_SAPPC|nr:hypothetical protein SPRG_02453 [Saprolegnia parasitica CBS 223.65]KDO32755.1 hypothetical protein SPRG_02453 [Saprolegnia parasitica CBS 223.65]|eukprot:XP_012196419.1 hypothetical protein SPRG_02453 [Saprolegnia parasitica CBS 223.65]